MQKNIRKRLGFGLVAFSAAVAVWAATQELPYVIMVPGETFNVLGEYHGTEIIQASGVSEADNPGRLDMVTVGIWGSPGNTPKIYDLIEPFFSNQKSILPLEDIYPVDQTVEEADAKSLKDFKDSQDAAIAAAKSKLPPELARSLKVDLHLDDVGGPSGGLMFTLGVLDKALTESLTGGKLIAGTGTISADGLVGPIGGINFKMIAARRAGDDYFLAPFENCSEVVGNIPEGLRVIPVKNIEDALVAVRVIANDGSLERLPVCSAK